MSWLDKIFGVKPKGTFEVVYSKSGTWDINYNGGKSSYNEYCHFDILYNDVTKKYKLECRGYKPESHSLYGELFKRMRLLNEGFAYHKGGELYSYNDTDAGKTNGKDISSMNETECQAYLNRALEDGREKAEESAIKQARLKTGLGKFKEWKFRLEKLSVRVDKFGRYIPHHQ